MGCVHSTVRDDADRLQEALKGPVAGAPIGLVTESVKASGAQEAPRPLVKDLDLNHHPQIKESGQQLQNERAISPSEHGTASVVVWREPDSPSDEVQRHSSLQAYNILDTEPEEAYDRISKLCKSLFKVPIAMVTFVDRDRVWLKSVCGLNGLKEVDRRQSLCAWTLLSRFPEALVVRDLREDVRFKDYPIVTGWPWVRFYAASPLVCSNGQRLGTLCILDYQPRDLSAENASLLAQLAAMVMREVERKRAMNDALCSAAVRHSGDSIAHDRQGIMLLDTANPKWLIHLVNDSWTRATGVGREMACGGHFWDLFDMPAPNQMQAVRLACEQKRNFELRVPMPRALAPCGSCAGDLPRSTSTATSGSGAGLVQPSASALISYSSQQQQQQQAAHLLSQHSGSWDCSGNYQQQQQVRDAGRDGRAICGGLQPNSAVAAAGLGGLPPLVPNPGSGSSRGFGDGVFVGSNSNNSGSGHNLGMPRRQSLSADHRRNFLRLQFRSASSASAMKLCTPISIPSMLLSQGDNESTNYYWATLDFEGDDGKGGWGGMGGGSHSCFPSGMTGFGGSDMGQSSNPSSMEHGPGGGSTEPQTPPKTTFNLLSEENPFSDITIGVLLGWGSYGRVHRGYWNGALVAVKVLEQIAGDVNPRTALEPLLHHQLSHPNVVKMYDISTQEVDVCEDGRPLQEVWMVLEFCNRGTLTEAISRGAMLQSLNGVPQLGCLDVRHVLATAREIASAMTYLHSQNVLHGDLNGNNILLVGSTPTPADDRDFSAKVADFGLSRMLAPDNDKIITRTHGTITHMAPEVIVESTHSKAADVYSFGVVLWEMITCKKAYHGMHYAQIVHSITTSKPLDVPKEVPQELQQLLGQCLAKLAADRPTFAEVLQRLQEMEVERMPPGAAAAAGPGAALQPQGQ